MKSDEFHTAELFLLPFAVKNVGHCLLIVGHGFLGFVVYLSKHVVNLAGLQ